MVAKKDVSEAVATIARTGVMSALKMHQENAAPDLGKQYLTPETKSRQNRLASELDTAAARAEQPGEKGISGGGSPPPQGRAPRAQRTVSAADHGRSLAGCNAECSSCCSWRRSCWGYLY